MASDDPAAIARRLSPAQRRALLWLPGDGTPREHSKGAPPEVSFWCMGSLTWGGKRGHAVTMEAHLCKRTGKDTFTPDQGWSPAYWNATPLGLAVRAVVAAEGGE